MDEATLTDGIARAIAHVDVDWPFARDSGKVREVFALPGDRRLLVATDRLFAFDVMLAAVPFKGQVLTQLSAFWFENTADLLPNHLLGLPDPNVSLVRACTPLPVHVIVYGYVSGSTRCSPWTRYAAGERNVYGYALPEGLRRNDPLPKPMITLSVRAGSGGHDRRLTRDEAVERGLVDPVTWEQVQAAALALFRRGQELASAAGLLLVDTKYEFGRAPDDTLMLIGELHTPDSSRFWSAAGLEAARGTRVEPEHWDKEFIRLWYVGQGYLGEGTPPPLPDDVIVALARRYIALHEGLTGQVFRPAPVPAGPRIAGVLRSFLTE